MDEFLSSEDLCRYLKLHKRSVQKLLQEGRIPGAFKIGNRWRIPRSSFEDFVQKAQEKTNK